MTKDERYNRSAKGKARYARYVAAHPERRRALTVANNARRVFGASGYLGLAPSAESAADLNQMARDFRAEQKGDS